MRSRKRGALRRRVGAETACRVEDDGAGGDRRYALDAELGQAIDLGESGGLLQ